MKKKKVFIAIQSIILFCLAFIAYIAYKKNFFTVSEVTVIVCIFIGIGIIINILNIYLVIKKNKDGNKK